MEAIKIIADSKQKYEDHFRQACLSSCSSSDAESSTLVHPSTEKLVATALSLAARDDNSATCLPAEIQKMREFQVLCAFYTFQRHAGTMVIQCTEENGDVHSFTLAQVFAAVVCANSDPTFLKEMVLDGKQSTDSVLIERRTNLNYIVGAALIVANTPEEGRGPDLSVPVIL